MRATRTPGPKYQELGLWDDDSLPTLLARAIRDNADDLAIVDRSVQLTYRDLGAEVDRLAAQLRSLGVAKGDVVLAQLPNWWEAVVLLQAVVRLGAVINPVVTIYREAELAFIVDQASPTVVVVPDRFRGHDHVAMVGRVLDDRPTGARPTVLVARPERPLPSWATALWANRIRGPGARRPDGAVEHSEMEQTCADDIDVYKRQPWLPLQSDPPSHRQYRLPLLPFFRPERVAGFEERLVELTNSLIDDFIDAGEADVAAKLNIPLPAMGMCLLLSLPESNWEHFYRWTTTIIDCSVEGDIDGIRDCFAEISDFANTWVAEIGRASCRERV